MFEYFRDPLPLESYRVVVGQNSGYRRDEREMNFHIEDKKLHERFELVASVDFLYSFSSLSVREEEFEAT